MPQHNTTNCHANDEQSVGGPVCDANNERAHSDTLFYTHDDTHGQSYDDPNGWANKGTNR